MNLYKNYRKIIYTSDKKFIIYMLIVRFFFDVSSIFAILVSWHQIYLIHMRKSVNVTIWGIPNFYFFLLRQYCRLKPLVILFPLTCFKDSLFRLFLTFKWLFLVIPAAETFVATKSLVGYPENISCTLTSVKVKFKQSNRQKYGQKEMWLIIIMFFFKYSHYFRSVFSAIFIIEKSTDHKKQI